MKKGRVTIPTNLDVVPQTLEILDEWGADAIRDCDGTEFPKELKDTGSKIYATYYTTRKDNEWAKAHPEEIQQMYIMTSFHTATEEKLEIHLMDHLYPDMLAVNTRDDIYRWWEVIDRTTGEPVSTELWSYEEETGNVVIRSAKLFHEYTVSFLAYIMWDPVHMYNAVVNDWKDVEPQITFDVRQPKTKAHSLERLRRFLDTHEYVDVVRFTTFFHQFTLIFDELADGQADDAAVDKSLGGVCDLDPAYIMYTSGSTGVPKGVTISNRGVIDYIEWIVETFPIDENSVIGMQSAFHFDNSVFDMYTAFYTGAKTMIIPEILFMYPEKLMDYMTENKISVIFWVPTVMISVANGGVLENADLSALKLILFAGEVMPNTQLNIWRKYLPECMYVNMYGPTEATDIATYYIVDREYENHETLPIGKVCRNMRALILNDDDKQCAVGEQGELCISGTGIALGYWNSPEITAKAFVQNPLNTKYHDRIYRTGDLVYENEEGNIIFIGRKDSQIKLRGNRIELGDLESAAAAIENVASACALFDADKQEIVLFIETTAEIVARKFKMKLKKYVPAYMVPGKIVTMEKFPHTPSGKIDRVGLRKTYITAE